MSHDVEPEPLPPPPDVDRKFDFSEEEKTPVEPTLCMEDELAELRSPGILTSTSERPTRPIRALRRPATIDNMTGTDG